MAKATVVRQAISSRSLFLVLSEWCKEGVGQKRWSLRILSAFVSGNGLRALSPLLDIFLSGGNSVEIIFGVDRGGTNRDALQRLHAFRRAYPGQASVRLFHAPAPASIFHPKLYLLETGSRLRVVLGSANLTLPGLSTNLESLVLYEGVGRGSRFGREILSLWTMFAAPAHPLKRKFLHDLTDRTLAKYVTTLPRKHPEERTGKTGVRNAWKPLSHVQLPGSSEVIGGGSSNRFLSTKSQYLLMDVLKETRQTQMQVPLPVIERFFQIDRDEEHEINLSILTEQELTQPIVRRVVKSTGTKRQRLMRRLEMPQIKSLDRPLAVLFLRVRGKNKYAYTLIPRSSLHFKKVNRLLRDHGQQGRMVRRFVIGKRGDAHWEKVRAFMPKVRPGTAR